MEWRSGEKPGKGDLWGGRVKDGTTLALLRDWMEGKVPAAALLP